MQVLNFDDAGGLTVDQSEYDAFINANSATFGPVPTISSTNRTLLQSILDDGDAVEFGAGIYPFDGEIVLGGKFDLRGSGRGQTLLWAPQSNFLHYTTAGATYPRLKELTIEAQGNVLRTDAWAVNAIHGLVAEDAAFVSYAGHAFENDRTTTGGTGCPIYGSKFTNVGVYAGAGKAAFYEWQSGSNVFDNVVDQHYYFNSRNTNSKGIMKALFWNSTVHLFCNSNISYSGMDYVYFYDRPGSLAWFGAENNLFEGNSYSFQAIAKVSTSNFYLTTRGNRYLQNGARETGHHYILDNGNSYINECDSPSPIYEEHGNIRNRSNAPVYCVTGFLDVGQTKRRLAYFGPRSEARDGQRAPGRLIPVPGQPAPDKATTAAEMQMSDMWTKYGEEIGYMQRMEWPLTLD